MTAHVVTQREETDYAESYPGEPPEFESELECPIGCNGWQECREDEHAVPGYDGENAGPWESDEDAPWYDEEEFEFHGVVHTWNGNGYGWTVPYDGCVVAGNDWQASLYFPDREGKWLMDDEWDDTVTLTDVCELDDKTPRGVFVRKMPDRGPNQYTPLFIASYLRSQDVPDDYAKAFGFEFWLEGRQTAVTLSPLAVAAAAKAGIPADYAHAADTYVSVFEHGEARAEAVVTLHKSGVPADYMALGITYRIPVRSLVEAHRNGVPPEYLAGMQDTGDADS